MMAEILSFTSTLSVMLLAAESMIQMYLFFASFEREIETIVIDEDLQLEANLISCNSIHLLYSLILAFAAYMFS